MDEMTEQTAEPLREYRKTRVLYIIEAMLEYFVNILMSGAYIAKVASTLGMSDSTVGIVVSLANLGAAFQLFALFFVGRYPMRRRAILFHTVNQAFFALVWLFPVFRMAAGTKIALFIAVLLGGHILNNVINSPKIAWYMSMVDDRRRGIFTAKKEMVSLIGGVAFSFAMGQVIDRCEAAGDLRRAFLIGGVTLCALAALHTFTLIFSQERPPEQGQHPIRVGESLRRLFSNRTFLRVLGLTTLCKISEAVATPFYGTYQVKELGFSMTFVSLLGLLYAVVRVVTSIFLGKFADKSSFARMLRLCYLFGTLGYAVMIFTVPSNGKVLYTVFYAGFHAIFGAGYTSCMINLIYDSVDHADRTGAYALFNAFGGLFGFGATLLLSNLVTYIQANGNRLFGIHAYAQQFLSALAVAFDLVLVLWLTAEIRYKRKTEKEKTK